MGKYEYLEDEAIADIAFKAYGMSLEEMFLFAGLATAHLQTDTSLLSPNHILALDIEKSTLDRLLKAFLEEILYYKDADLIFAIDFDIDIEQSENVYKLTGRLIGDTFDYEKFPMHNDLKAITWHNLYVKQIGDTWECYVLIDI